jgi:hypothetical protein
MTNKTKLLILIIVLALIGGAVYLTLGKNKTNQPMPTETKKEATKPTEEKMPVEVKSPGTTIEGMIISLGEKEIAISNNTPTPALIGINAKTPVVKLDKDGKETEAGLSDIIAGENAKVLYDADAPKKEAKKIFLLGKK